ncbi:MAG: helix-hairpin-helix domain-containing protein [Pseudomonadaceae bacterium]|jgi:competence protein ComEA|nr:helix-hairpin-helix domain-containing protein [Pseudomonadaceae bacterium]
MQKTHISSVLFALLAGFSLAVSAAESAAPQAAMVTPVQTAAAPAEAIESTKVNLNTADAVTLERELLGVGEVKAQAIVAYRTANGAFASVDDLLEVKGIGAATLEKNRDKLSIN